MIDLFRLTWCNLCCQIDYSVLFFFFYFLFICWCWCWCCVFNVIELFPLNLPCRFKPICIQTHCVVVRTFFTFFYVLQIPGAFDQVKEQKEKWRINTKKKNKRQKTTNEECVHFSHIHFAICTCCAVQISRINCCYANLK